MARMNVTLKAEMKRGSFYWVTSVDADSKEEAIVAAEHLFQEEMDNAGDWSFGDFEVTPE
jgi:hypothetical protein